MVRTLYNETLGGPQQIVFLAYHKSKHQRRYLPISNQGYPVSGSVEIITKFERYRHGMCYRVSSVFVLSILF